MITDYWCNSKIADAIRGTPKLKYGTLEEWRDWRIKAQTAHPIRYWIIETALAAIQRWYEWIPPKVNNVRCYANNRFLVKSHALTAHPRDIKPGTWCDLSNRILPCMFNELVDFVEIEKAWMLVAWDKEARAKFEMPWWRGKWWTRWFVQWRCPEAGIEHLKWEMSLVDDYKGSATFGQPTPQAIAAKEIYDLYIWWTTVHRNRPDPFDESGLTGWYDTHKNTTDIYDLLDFNSETEEESAEHSICSMKHDLIERSYFDEDTQMMKRLIDVRGSLWT